jgi:hypothetical protein
MVEELVCFFREPLLARLPIIIVVSSHIHHHSHDYHRHLSYQFAMCSFLVEVEIRAKFSKYMGVSWHKNNRKWIGQAQGKTLGTFSSQKKVV